MYAPKYYQRGSTGLLVLVGIVGLIIVAALVTRHQVITDRSGRQHGTESEEQASETGAETPATTGGETVSGGGTEVPSAPASTPSNGAMALLSDSVLPVSFDSSQVEFVEEQTVDSDAGMVKGILYRNNAYRCAEAGNHTYAVIEPVGLAGVEAPAVVYLRGGSAGHFNADGSYQGSRQTINEPDLEGTLDNPYAFISGGRTDDYLTQLVAAGYRVMAPSYCDHDIYTGIGNDDPYNPNFGGTAKTEGLIATRSSLDHFLSTYPTSAFVIHGTSAGSSGVWTLGMQLFTEGASRPPVVGLIPDAFVNSPRYEEMFAAACLPEVYRGGKDWDIFQERMYPIGTEDRYKMENVIGDTAWDIPIFMPWATGDTQCCGPEPAIGTAVAAGYTNNCEYQYDPLLAILDTKGPLYKHYRVDIEQHVLLTNSVATPAELHNQVVAWVQDLVN